MNLADFLLEFRTATGANIGTPDDEGRIGLRFDNDLEITLEESDDGATLVIFADLGPAAALPDADCLATCLILNAGLLVNRQCAIVLHEHDRRLLLVRALPLAGAHYSHIAAIMDEFLTTLGETREQIGNSVQGTSHEGSVPVYEALV